VNRLFSTLVVLLLCTPAAAQLKLGGNTDNLLEPEKAFRFDARALDASTIEVHFAIADGYYLYRDRFRFSAEGNRGVRLGAPEFPRGLKHKDEFFGEVETYRKEVRIRIPVEGDGRFDLKVVSQGCADAGVCYVPLESKLSLRLAGSGEAAAPRFSVYASDIDIARLFEGNFAIVLGGFLLFGLLLTFTPCVLPMIPILSGIIAGEGAELNKLRALALSLSYVLGMAIAYAAAGIAAAFSGSLIAAALQSAWVLGSFALVFVVLALSMFGFYDLRLPGFLHHRLHHAHRRLQGGRVASVAAMGVLSAVIVSPCVAAPLAGALLYISQTRDVALGGAALFAMALGMGVPLIVVGVSEGALLPKAGAWMNGVKKFFGVLLLAVALWIVSPVIPAAAQMIAWAALLIGSGMFLRAIDPLPRRHRAGGGCGRPRASRCSPRAWLFWSVRSREAAIRCARLPALQAGAPPPRRRCRGCGLRLWASWRSGCAPAASRRCSTSMPTGACRARRWRRTRSRILACVPSSRAWSFCKPTSPRAAKPTARCSGALRSSGRRESSSSMRRDARSRACGSSATRTPSAS